MQMLDALLMMYIDIPEKMNPGVSGALARIMRSVSLVWVHDCTYVYK